MSRLQKISSSLFVLLIFGSATSGFAYVTGGALWPTDAPCNGSCAGKPVTIRYTIGNITDGTLKMPDGNTLSPSLIRDSINDALHVWTTAVNINFVAFSAFLGDLVGQVFALLILTVAAAEAAIGLAVVVSYFRNRGTIEVEDISTLKR